MILMETPDACRHCPNNMVCLAGKRIQEACYCRKCGAVKFAHTGEIYLCMLLRDGHYKRQVDRHQPTRTRSIDDLKQNPRLLRAATAIDFPGEFIGCAAASFRPGEDCRKHSVFTARH